MFVELKGYFRLKDKDFIDFNTGERVTLSDDEIVKYADQHMIRNWSLGFETLSNWYSTSYERRLNYDYGFTYGDISYMFDGDETVRFGGRLSPFEYIFDLSENARPAELYDTVKDRHKLFYMLGAIDINKEIVALVPDAADDVYVRVAWAYRYSGMHIVKYVINMNSTEFMHVCYDKDFNLLGISSTDNGKYFVFDSKYLNNGVMARLSFIL